MNSVDLSKQAVSPLRAFEESVHDLFSTVEIRQTQAHRGLYKGMVGKVLDQFGSPPTHYSVAVSEVDSYGIFGAAYVRRPRETQPPAISPHTRAASRAYVLQEAGYYTGDPSAPIESDADRQWRAASLQHIQEETRRAIGCAAASCVSDYPYFTERYGPIFDATLSMRGINGQLVEALSSWQYPKLDTGEISSAPTMLVLMPIRLIAGAPLSLAPLSPDLLSTDAKLGTAQRSGWYKFPTEIWENIITYLGIQNLNAFSPICRSSRRLVHEECRQSERTNAVLSRLELLMEPQWSCAVDKYCHLIPSMEGTFKIPLNLSEQKMRGFSRLTQDSGLRGEIFLGPHNDAPRLLSIPSGINVHLTLDDNRSLLFKKDLPRLPQTLCTFSLHLRETSGAGLCSLLAKISSQTKLSVIMDAFYSSPGRIAIPAAGQLQHLSLPARTARGGHLQSWIRLPGLSSLSLTDEESVAHLDRQQRPVQNNRTIRLSDSLKFLNCGPRMFAFFAGLENLRFLRSVFLSGSGLAVAIENLRRLPFLEDLALSEQDDTDGSENADDDSLGRAMTRWPLGPSIRTLALRSASIGEHFGQIQWPSNLTRLDLSFCPIGPAIRQMQGLEMLERLDLTYTEVQNAIFDTPWPRALREVDIDASDIPEGSLNDLLARFETIQFNIFDY